MKLPKSVTVFGHRYKVKAEKDLCRQGAYGMCDRLKKIIHIDADLKGDPLYHTLIHELGHALFDRIGICQGISSDLEEVIVENVATMILENFKIKFKD